MSCQELTRQGLQCSREGQYAGCCSQHMNIKLNGKKQGISLIEVVNANDGKHKYTAIFNIDGKEKHTSFGAEGYGDFIIFTKELGKEEGLYKREQYWRRHSKDLQSLDLTSAGWLSLFILWGDYPDLQKNTKDYKKRFNL